MAGDQGTAGTFKDRKSATKAVRRLAEKSVPADTIKVLVINDDGTVKREVRVDDEAGVLRGAMLGAAWGAGGGVLLLVLVATGIIGVAEGSIFSFESIQGSLWVVITGVILGLPLGAILGLGMWSGRERISAHEAEAGSIRVVVTSEALSEVARAVFEETGAQSISAR